MERVDDDAVRREANYFRIRNARRWLLLKAMWPMAIVVVVLLLVNEPSWFGRLEPTDSAHWFKQGHYVTEFELIVSNGSAVLAIIMLALFWGDRGRLEERVHRSWQDWVAFGIRILLLLGVVANLMLFLHARGHWPVSGQ